MKQPDNNSSESLRKYTQIATDATQNVWNRSLQQVIGLIVLGVASRYTSHPWITGAIGVIGVALISIDFQEYFDIKRATSERQKVDSLAASLVTSKSSDLVHLLQAPNLEIVARENSVSVQALNQQLQQHLDNSDLMQDASSEISLYLQPMPRQAKRLVNHLRVELMIAAKRGLLEAGTGITPAHVGKWTLIRERWPELTEYVYSDPSLLREWEAQAGQSGEFRKTMETLLPGIREMDLNALERCFQSPTKLGGIMESLISVMKNPVPTTVGLPA